MGSLQYVRTKRASWLVLEVTDKLRQSMGLMYGYCMHLEAVRDWTWDNKNKVRKKVLSYNRYVTTEPVQVCRLLDIVEQREANETEAFWWDVCRRYPKKFPPTSEQSDEMKRSLKDIRGELRESCLTDNTV